MGYRGASKTKVAQTNIIKERAGVGRPAANIQTVKEACQLLISQDVTLLLVREANRRAHLVIRLERSKFWQRTSMEGD